MPALVRRDAPGSPEVPTRSVQRLAERMLGLLNIEAAELSVLLTDDATIHRLNYEHRQKDKPTDVLSFPLMDPDDEQLATLDGGALGDVVISLDTAQRQASNRGIDLMDELARLLAHGLLHLLGYDHQNDTEEAEMQRMEALLLAQGVTRDPATAATGRGPVRISGKSA
jgi:probable rRNA maturation factor